MSSVGVAPWLSIGLSLPAAIAVARRTTGDTRPSLTVLFGTIAYVTLLVVPVQAEATLELVGLLDRVTLLGPALVSGAVLLLVVLRGETEDTTGRPGARGALRRAWARLPLSVRAAAGTVAAVYALFALERLSGFPQTWDGVAYHLPVVAGWLKDGSLALASNAHYYEAIPTNADLLSMFAVATGWHGFAEVWNVVSAAAAVSGSYVLARVVGVDRTGSGVAALVVAAIPMVLHQAFSSYVDLFVAGFLVAAVALLAGVATGRMTVDRPGTALVGAGLACGLAVGAKATAWPFALLIAGATVTWLLLAEVHRGRRWTLTSLFAGAVAVPSLFWFGRNFAATGNPAYPLEIVLMGRTIFEGTAASEITGKPSDASVLADLGHLLVYPWTERKSAGYPFSPGSGFGPLYAALAVPGALYLLWRLRPWRDPENDGRANRRYRLALVGTLAALFAGWWFALGPVWRFGLVVIVLVPVLAAPFLEGFHRHAPRVFGPVLLVSVVLFGAISALPPIHSLAHRIRHGEWNWSSYYHLPVEFSSLPDDVPVVNFDVEKEAWNNFALLGPELDRPVVPYWKVKATLQREELLAVCPAYVVDRPPFQLRPDEAPFAHGTLRLVSETDAQHGDTRWRIWKLEGCEGTGGADSTESPRDG